ncbi:hypothetical protein H0E84_09120 [Luteimonas sp. SJ-92]|uniref:Uncharacterized protein n=1 Tax=Luteimonas salinisoli TaxID=2752307 RepID=A0A853JBC5_9GAMM|nr:hypothetical protein [Luteimonas salinisoli]NZA26546.1 hypothetical protein [Luteimonas salinisoli]
MPPVRRLARARGQIRLDIEHSPIASVECCCDSRAAGIRLQQLPPQIPFGGTIDA